MVEVTFGWEDDGTALIHSIKCGCGAEYKEYEQTVSSDDVWQCPKCGKRIKFVWKGMSFKEMIKEQETA